MKNIASLVIVLLLSMGSQAQSLTEAIGMTNGERFAPAALVFRGLLAASPKDGETWFYYGENFYYNDQLDSAEMCYRRGIEFNPRNPLSYAGLGKILWSKGAKAEAQVQFQQAITAATDRESKFSKKLQAQTQREVAEGMAFGPEGEPIKAMAHIDQALLLDPNDPESYIMKGDIQLEANPSDATGPLVNYKRAIDMAPSSARPVAKKALMYHRAVNYEAAIAEYTKAIGLDPAFAPAYRGRAESFFMSRKYDLATADYNTYLALNKGDQSARVRYAQFLYLVKSYKESLALIQELEQEGVKNNSLARLKGYDLVELKDSTRAVQAMEAYFAVQPTDKLLSSDVQYYGRAIALLGNDSLAGEKLLAAARMKGADPDLFAEAGSMFQRARLYTKAMEAYKAKVASGKVAVNDWYYLGGIALRAQAYGTADTAWAEYITKQPNIYQGYLGRARANVGLDPEKKTWQAHTYYEEVTRRMKPEEVTKSPSDAEEAYFYLGFYHFYSTKDLTMAKCWFEKVKATNAGTANTKIANDMLLSKDLKDVHTGACELP
ncbi:MAG: tetratricopeptide repeat protein [Flavobacteriales bacterium]|nr:tetratricopeptide repeat protein [Flavobacteriales bacterium]